MQFKRKAGAGLVTTPCSCWTAVTMGERRSQMAPGPWFFSGFSRRPLGPATFQQPFCDLSMTARYAQRDSKKAVAFWDGRRISTRAGGLPCERSRELGTGPGPAVAFGLASQARVVWFIFRCVFRFMRTHAHIHTCGIIPVGKHEHTRTRNFPSGTWVLP